MVGTNKKNTSPKGVVLEMQGGLVQDIIRIKPKRTSFLITRTRVVVVVSLILAVVLGVAGVVSNVRLVSVAAAVQLVVLVGLTLAAALVAYSKENYELHPHHLVVHRGGVFSTQTTELDLKNVTHVKQHLPWFRYRFFDVGDVIVESAGSSGAEATLRSIRNPDAVYAEIRRRLRDNGFALTSTEFVHRAQPATIGIVLECIGRGGSALIGLVWLAGTLMSAGLAKTADGGNLVFAAVAILGAVGMVGAVGTTVLHFLDMRRRTYTLTRDAVIYEEGFLNRDNAFIPFENIADADTRKTLIDQIIGLADVRISCQGSSSEVSFRRLKNAELMTSALKELVEEASNRQAARVAEDSPVATAQGTAAEKSFSWSKPSGFEAVPAAEAWTARLAPNPMRAAFGLLPLLPLLPIWLLLSLFAAIRAAATSYEVGRSSVSHRYRLIGEHEVSFAYDKITGVVVTRTPFDRPFGTLSIRFQSIGSGTPLELAHVPAKSVNLRALLRQAGIPGGPAVATELADFSPAVWAKSAVGGFIGLGFISAAVLAMALFHHRAWFLGLILMLCLIGVHYLIEKLRADRQKLSFHPAHVELRKGILIRTHALARFENVKKVEVLRYPWSHQGRLTLSVAGEIRLQQQGGPGKQPGQGGAVRQFSLSAAFLSDIDAKRFSVDALLHGRVDPAEVDDITQPRPPDVLDETGPALGNSVVAMGLVGIVVPPLWLFIPLVILQLRRTSYRVEAERVVLERGILYRKHSSILFDRIDSLKQGQGPLNKLFANGNITLFTAGSSTPDLKLTAVPDHRRVYKLIRSHYGKRE